MTSIVELFPKTRKLAYDSRQQLSQVQNNIISPSELHISLDELKRQLDLLEKLIFNETPVQREVWKRKLLELREDASSIQRQGVYYDQMVNANTKVLREREQLLKRRRRVGGDAENGLNDLADEANSLSQSQNMVEELLQRGEAQHSSLVSQRRRMTSVKRVVLEIGNKLGLTNQTMQIIQKRDATDAYFVFGGMFLTSCVIYLVWFR